MFLRKICVVFVLFLWYNQELYEYELSDFKDNDIDSVEEIELNFRVYDDENLYGDDSVNEKVTLKP